MSASSATVPVVSYARISADTRRDEHGVQDQHEVNRATATRLGWSVVHEFTDNDKSAAKAGVVRDDFENMLRVLRAGKLSDGTAILGAVVVADDRLARRPGDYERFPAAWADPRARRWNLWGYIDERDAAAACRLALEAPAEAVGGSPSFIIAAAETVMNRPSAELLAEVFPGSR